MSRKSCPPGCTCGRHSAEVRAMMKERWADPEWRAAQIEKWKRGWDNAERKAAAGARSKARWADPEMRVRMLRHRRGEEAA